MSGSPKEIANHEIRITVFRALVGVLITAILAAGSTYLAVRDQLVRSEEWGRNVAAQLTALSARLDDVAAQVIATRESVARLEGARSARSDRTEDR